jgi:hypothetical protein
VQPLQTLGCRLRHSATEQLVDSDRDGFRRNPSLHIPIGDSRQSWPAPHQAQVLAVPAHIEAEAQLLIRMNLSRHQHVAKNRSGRCSALPGEDAQTDGYNLSMQCRKRI